MPVTGLIITILIFTFIMLIKAKVILILEDEEMTLKLRICGIPITILPAKEKQVDIDYYSKEAMEKRRLAEIKKQKNKKLKKEKKKKNKELKAQKEKERIEKLKKEGKYTPPKKKEKSETDLTLVDNINAGVAALGKFFYQFGKRLRIDVAKIVITVATGDAASTAIMYGAVISAVNVLIELLQKIMNLNGLKDAEIDVKCDYLGSKTKADIHVALSLRVWHIFDFLIAALRAFLKKRKKIKTAKVRLAARKHRAAEIIKAKREAAAKKSKQTT